MSTKWDRVALVLGYADWESIHPDTRKQIQAVARNAYGTLWVRSDLILAAWYTHHRRFGEAAFYIERDRRQKTTDPDAAWLREQADEYLVSGRRYASARLHAIAERLEAPLKRKTR